MSFNVSIGGHVQRPTTEDHKAELEADAEVQTVIQECVDKLSRLEGATSVFASGYIGYLGTVSVYPTKAEPEEKESK